MGTSIGFFNRKPFLLLLLYMLLVTLAALLWNTPAFLQACARLANVDWATACFVALFAFSLFMLCVMGPFVLASFRAYLHNYTYLEELTQSDLKKYDRGFKANHSQVFGLNRWLDPLPFHGRRGLPGDGLRWVDHDLQYSFCLEGNN